jgi:hypothetical protein
MPEPLEDAGAAKGRHFSFGYLFLGPPDLGKIEDLVRCCERRKARAADKLASARPKAPMPKRPTNSSPPRADWIANGPDAQLLML